MRPYPLGKTSLAVLAHMQREHQESEFLALCRRDENAAEKLVLAGLATVRAEPDPLMPLSASLRFYRLTAEGKKHPAAS